MARIRFTHALIAALMTAAGTCLGACLATSTPPSLVTPSSDFMAGCWNRTDDASATLHQLCFTSTGHTYTSQGPVVDSEKDLKEPHQYEVSSGFLTLFLKNSPEKLCFQLKDFLADNTGPKSMKLSPYTRKPVAESCSVDASTPQATWMRAN